jgi:hypothetical protein
MLQNYLLELDGRPAGRFFDFAGGMAEGEVVTVKTGGTNQVDKKHIGSVRYQDMVMTCGTGMSRGFYEWLGSGFEGMNSRLTGAVLALDNKQVPTARLDFRDALIKSVVLPELERGANKEAYLTVKLSPEQTLRKDPDPKTKLGVYASALQRAWNIGSFRLSIVGLEAECAKVTRINSLNLGQRMTLHNFGESRDGQKEGTKLEYSNLVVKLPAMSAKGFIKWHEDFVVHGNNSNKAEKNGNLEFFAPNSTQPYFLLEFSNLGIMSISGLSGLNTNTGVPITVEMYCEKMKFVAGSAAVK